MTWGSSCPQCGKNKCRWMYGPICEGNAAQFLAKIEADRAEVASLVDQVRRLRGVIYGMNHMGGDERGGYCICPAKDGSAPDERHATICRDARAAAARATATA